jgi:hypothetical protein
MLRFVQYLSALDDESKASTTFRLQSVLLLPVNPAAPGTKDEHTFLEINRKQLVNTLATVRCLMTLFVRID